MLDLFEEDAPTHTARFKELARAGVYDGTPFHRVVAGFIAQAGRPAAAASIDLPEPLAPEFGKPFVHGAVGAARLRDAENPERLSDPTQFFIVLGEGAAEEHTIFGHVVEGMAVLEALTELEPPATGGDVIQQVEIETISPTDRR